MSLNPRLFRQPSVVRREATARTFWHGTPDERTWGTAAHYGIHVGTKRAAQDALHARVGKPVEGEWRGDREYGKTLLQSGQATGADGVRDASRDHYPKPASYREIIRHPKGGFSYGSPVSKEERDPAKSYSPSGAHYSNSEPVPLDARPSIFPVRIKGEMTNSQFNPHEDVRANALMAGQLKQGRAKRGYFYTNEAEDEGSISAVVPSRAHLEDLRLSPQFGRVSRYRHS